MRAIHPLLLIQICLTATFFGCHGYNTIEIEGEATMYLHPEYQGQSFVFPIYNGCFNFLSYDWAYHLSDQVSSIRLSSPSSCLRVYLHPSCLGHSAEVRGDEEFEICRRNLGNCGWRNMISSASGCSYEPGEDYESSLMGSPRGSDAIDARGHLRGLRCSGRCTFSSAVGGRQYRCPVNYPHGLIERGCSPRKSGTTRWGEDCHSHCYRNSCTYIQLKDSVAYVRGGYPSWISRDTWCP